MNMHDLHDKKSLEYHRIIADKLRSDPALIAIAFANLEESKKIHPNSRAWQEWELILMGSIDHICNFISSDSENSKKLRQSSPFHGLITKAERDAILKDIFSGLIKN